MRVVLSLILINLNVFFYYYVLSPLGINFRLVPAFNVIFIYANFCLNFSQKHLFIFEEKT